MKPRQSPSEREAVRHHAILPRFRDAFYGIYQAYREEPNLRFHFFATSCAAAAGYAVRLQGWETAYLAVTVAVVLLAEMVNTAVERTVDFAAAGRRHRLAGQAKEVAAGGVLLASLHAMFAAFYLFLYNRGFFETLNAVISTVVHQPWMALLPLAAGVLGLVGGERSTE